MNKRERRVRFGVADIVIILLVLAAIGASVWFFAVGPLFDGGETADISYEVRLTNIRSEMASHIKQGDPVYDGVYGEAIGTVENISVEQYTEQVLDKSTGELVNAVKEGYFNIYIKVNAKAKYKDGAYLIADTDIRVGQSLYLHLPDFCGNGYCTAFTVAGEE